MTGGLLTFLSVTGTFGFGLNEPLCLVEVTGRFLELVVVSVACMVLVGGLAEHNTAGGRLVTARLDSCAVLVNAAFVIESAVVLVLQGGRSTDFDLIFLCVSVLVSNLSTLVLDLQIDPIFDWTILPLYMPGAGLGACRAVGAFTGASVVIFLFFSAWSLLNAFLCVCCCVTSEEASCFCRVFIFF